MYRLQRHMWWIYNNNFIRFTNACHRQLLLVNKSKWEFCVLCAHYLISRLYSTQALNINDFLNIRITFFGSTTYRHNNAKDKTAKSCRKASAWQEKETNISTGWLVLGDGSIPKYQQEIKSKSLAQTDEYYRKECLEWRKDSAMPKTESHVIARLVTQISPTDKAHNSEKWGTAASLKP